MQRQGLMGSAASLLVLAGSLLGATMATASPEQRQLLWGDTHVHTSYSFDAFLNGNQSADPDVAYRWARGFPVIHPYNRTRVRIGTPLDFLVIADHAEFYGGIRDIYLEGVQDPDPNPLDSILYRYGEWRIRNAIDSGKGMEYFAEQLPQSAEPEEAARAWSADTATKLPPGAAFSAANAWTRMLAIADAHNTPGVFTALLGWEWSSVPGGANLHRVVITDAGSERAAKFMPFSSADSPYPEDLWNWLEKTSAETGARFLAIPHNSNISKGRMFGEQTLRGEPIGEEYAQQRLRWEPVTEVTQIKGDSETHPVLSPEDEFADFERYPWYIQQNRADEVYDPRPGDFVRSALRTGLAMESRIGVNPYRMGMIGSTDTHSGLASAEEPNFWGKMAYDSVPENKQGRTIADGPTGWTMQAGGLAAVWAEENSRNALLDAFARREVYASTGPRIRVRLFAGYDFGEQDLQAEDFAARGYAGGVPMGGELSRHEDNAAPRFMVIAHKDPRSANLDRIQIIKGWIDANGDTHEKIHDIAWSEGRARRADGRLEAVGDTVDRGNATWSDTIGTAQLQALWEDPDFDPQQAAFYYTRTLEIPTPRHALLDAIALGLKEPTEGPSIIQERAYTSPVWYTP